jgi:hypothetical protein
MLVNPFSLVETWKLWETNVETLMRSAEPGGTSPDFRDKTRGVGSVGTNLPGLYGLIVS